MLHRLKIMPLYFEAVKDGRKQFEVRKNDRDYQIGDDLLLQEYSSGAYTGRLLHRKICYILHGGQFGIEKGYVVLGLEKI